MKFDRIRTWTFRVRARWLKFCCDLGDATPVLLDRFCPFEDRVFL